MDGHGVKLPLREDNLRRVLGDGVPAEEAPSPPFCSSTAGERNQTCGIKFLEALLVNGAVLQARDTPPLFKPREHDAGLGDALVVLPQKRHLRKADLHVRRTGRGGVLYTAR